MLIRCNNVIYNTIHFGASHKVLDIIYSFWLYTSIFFPITFSIIISKSRETFYYYSGMHWIFFGPFLHIHQRTQNNLGIPFSYQPHQVLSTIDTPGTWHHLLIMSGHPGSEPSYHCPHLVLQLIQNRTWRILDFHQWRPSIQIRF